MSFEGTLYKIECFFGAEDAVVVSGVRYTCGAGVERI